MLPDTSQTSGAVRRRQAGRKSVALGGGSSIAGLVTGMSTTAAEEEAEAAAAAASLAARSLALARRDMSEGGLFHRAVGALDAYHTCKGYEAVPLGLLGSPGRGRAWLVRRTRFGVKGGEDVPAPVKLECVG